MSRNRGRSRNTGRRGRKHRKEEARAQRKRAEASKALQVEYDRRKKLIEWLQPRIAMICELSELGIAIEKRTVLLGGRLPRELYITKLTSEGHVHSSTWKVDTVEIHEVTPWIELNSTVLKRFKEADWKPLWPKNILDRLVDI